MTELEAKNFLVQQAAEQAALENVSLSDLEKRMMYFTESGEMREDLVELNSAFEAEYNTDDYERKISKLLHHARARIKKENAETERRWNDAFRELNKGDHYILVLWGEYTGERNTERPKFDSLKLLATGLLVGGVLLFGVWIAVVMHNRYGSTMPLWLQRTMIAAMVGGYVYFVIVRWIWKTGPPGLGQLLVKVFRPNNVDSRK